MSTEIYYMISQTNTNTEKVIIAVTINRFHFWQVIWCFQHWEWPRINGGRYKMFGEVKVTRKHHGFNELIYLLKTLVAYSWLTICDLKVKEVKWVYFFSGFPIRNLSIEYTCVCLFYYSWIYVTSGVHRSLWWFKHSFDSVCYNAATLLFAYLNYKFCQYEVHILCRLCMDTRWYVVIFTFAWCFNSSLDYNISIMLHIIIERVMNYLSGFGHICRILPIVNKQYIVHFSSSLYGSAFLHVPAHHWSPDAYQVSHCF